METFSIPIGEKGVIVLTHLGKAEFNIRKFNADLEQVWMNQGSIEGNLDYVTHCYDGNRLYLLFSRFKSNNYYIVRVNPNITYGGCHWLLSVDCNCASNWCPLAVLLNINVSN